MKDIKQAINRLKDIYFDPTKKYNVLAIITDHRGNILSEGVNSYVKTHPEQARIASSLGFSGKKYLHAEVAALVRTKNSQYHKRKRMFVVRVDKKGNPRNAEPCLICKEALRLAQLDNVYWSTER